MLTISREGFPGLMVSPVSVVRGQRHCMGIQARKRQMGREIHSFSFALLADEKAARLDHPTNTPSRLLFCL